MVTRARIVFVAIFVFALTLGGNALALTFTVKGAQLESIKKACPGRALLPLMNPQKEKANKAFPGFGTFKNANVTCNKSFKTYKKDSLQLKCQAPKKKGPDAVISCFPIEVK